MKMIIIISTTKNTRNINVNNSSILSIGDATLFITITPAFTNIKTTKKNKLVLFIDRSVDNWPPILCFAYSKWRLLDLRNILKWKKKTNY